MNMSLTLLRIVTVSLTMIVVACTGNSTKTTAPASTPVSELPIEQVQGVLGVNHVGLTVSDIEVSKEFFVEALGFRVFGGMEDYPSYFLTNGHAKITLWQVKDPTATVTFNRAQNIGLHHLALTVSSLEALNSAYETVRKYPGVKMEFAPEPNGSGPIMHMMFYEPSGNRIELAYPGTESSRTSH